MAVRKTAKGLALKRWFKEKWKDEKGNPCGSSKNKAVKKCRPSKKVSKKTPVTWGGLGSRKASVVAVFVQFFVSFSPSPFFRRSKEKQ